MIYRWGRVWEGGREGEEGGKEGGEGGIAMSLKLMIF